MDVIIYSRMRIIFIFLIGIFFLFVGCKKKEPTIIPFTYTSLKASDSTIRVNEMTNIVAEATGDELVYKWSYLWNICR